MPVEPGHPTPGAEERVLGVVGVVDRAEHPVAVRVELLALGLHEPAEGVVVPVARRFEQLAVPRGCGAGAHLAYTVSFAALRSRYA